jgi:pyruvate/2-oxoglutarate dehydrogenase complex dihydrolipoamide acyltransferase (E2) component
VEFIVGAFVALGFLAILVRFIARDASGEVRLPRIVDDSIGMWTLRRLSGRRLGQGDGDDELDDGLVIDPDAADATRAALGAAVAATSRRAPSRAAVSAHMVSATPVLDLRRRQQARLGRRRSPSMRRLAAFAAIAAVLIVAIAVGAAIGAADRSPSPQGEVLAATGHPQLSAPTRAPTGKPSPKATAKPTPTLSR